MELVRDRASLARSRRRPLIECAQCGGEIYIPEWSENLEGDCVRHLWVCEACGYWFETMIRFAAA